MNVLLLIVVFDTGTVAQHTWLFVEVLKNFAGDRGSAHLALCAGVGSARCQVLCPEVTSPRLVRPTRLSTR